MSFDAIGIAGTGMSVHRKWLDGVADNLANMNTAARTDGEVFRARYLVAQEGAGGEGVFVTGAVFGDAEGRLVHDPTHPLADAEGYVRFPDIDLAAQMGQLIMAQRGYQSNAVVVDRARASYEAALQIGRQS